MRGVEAPQFATSTEDRNSMTFETMASSFAVALKERRFSDAHQLLCASRQAELSADEIQRLIESVVQTDRVEHVEVIETLTTWPDKQADDVGWAYVAMSGKDFSEAVTVVVCGEQGRLCIRDVVWGRP
jgi:hypothetical protein